MTFPREFIAPWAMFLMLGCGVGCSLIVDGDEEAQSTGSSSDTADDTHQDTDSQTSTAEDTNKDTNTQEMTDDTHSSTDTGSSTASGSASDTGTDSVSETHSETQTDSDTETDPAGPVVCNPENTEKLCGPEGWCVDGYCCDTLCQGPCMTCGAPGFEGLCSPHEGGQDPEDNCGLCRVCDGAGGCTLAASGRDPKDDCSAADASTCGLTGTCDGNGQCAQYPQGTNCGESLCNDIAGGESVISEQTCDGQGVCLISSHTCGGYNCSQSLISCRKSCSTNSDCNNGFSCDANGVCLGAKPNAETCFLDSECSSGHCADGVCCETACNGICEVCHQQGFLGKCVAAEENSDPRDDCPTCYICNGARACKVVAMGQDYGGDCPEDGEPFGCGLSGACNGRGGCAYRGIDHSCEASVCSNVPQKPSVLFEYNCDGQGTCTPSEQTCGSFRCADEGACLSACSTNDDCVGLSVCSAPECRDAKENGESCVNDFECESANCIDRVCCATACDQVCERCDLQGSAGTCELVEDFTDPDAECGTCEVCVSGGCAFAEDGGDPKDDCVVAPDGQCSTTGSCNGLGECALRGGDYQCGTVCSGGLVAPFYCDGTVGGCTVRGAQEPCEGGFACASSSACAVVCSGDGNCVEGHFCNGAPNGTCEPLFNQGEPCDSSNQCASKHCVDGFCCDGPCEGTCESCDQGAAAGVCTTHPIHTDPDDDCAECEACDSSRACSLLFDNPAPEGDCAATETCGPTGQCVAGSCQLEAVNTPCQTPVCNSSMPGSPVLTTWKCDGLGGCQKSVTTCGGYLCASATACSTSCGSCAEGYFCNNGVCTADKAQGSTCSLGSECNTGHCVDGHCCEHACAAECMTCGNEQGLCQYQADATWGYSGANYADLDCSAACQVCNGAGGCRAVVAVDGEGENSGDPRNDCSPGEPLQCGRTGVCQSAEGYCARYGGETVCDVTCDNVTSPYNQLSEWRCSGGLSSTCTKDATSNSCPSNLTCLDSTVCRTVCSSNADCAPTTSYFCNTAVGACEAKVSNGATCTASWQCLTGHCTDEVCCDAPCNGVCEACNLPGSSGTCVAVPNGQDPEGECQDGQYCTGDDTCDGNRTCTHSGNPCAGGTLCNNTCNEAEDHCFTGAGTACDDSRWCTAASQCNGSGSCAGTKNTCDHGECIEDLQECDCASEPGWTGAYCEVCVVYVDANSTSASPDGSSWSMAYQSLQAGVDHANQKSCQVWVAEGTYEVADYGPGGLLMLGKVEIYGGFVAGDPYFEDRSPQHTKPILDGRHAAYHVVSCLSANGCTTGAVLDGFVLTRGDARVSGDNSGGGLHVLTTSSAMPRFSNLVITGNRASYGGAGINITMGSPSFEGLVVTNNAIALNGNNGGGLLSFGTNVVFENSIFAGNYADYFGGGLYGNFVCNNCVIAGNTASQRSGGGVGGYDARIVLANTTLYRNIAPNGAAVYATKGSLRIVNSILWDNINTTSGGEIIQLSDNDTAIAQNIVQGGFSGDGNLSDDPLFVLATPTDHTRGTVVDLDFNPGTGLTRIVLTEETWAGVKIHEPGSLVGKFILPNRYHDGRMLPIIANDATSVWVWGDISDWTGTGKYYEIQDLRLGNRSPAIDYASEKLEPPPLPKDILGKLRFDEPFTAEGLADIGAYEYRGCVVIVHGNTGNDDNNGLIWAKPKRTLRNALTRAVVRAANPAEAPDGVCEVWVYGTSYLVSAAEPPLPLGPGVQLYGGFGGAESSRWQREWGPGLNETTITGDGAASVLLSCDKNNFCNLETVVDGFYLRGSTIHAISVDATGVSNPMEPTLRNLEIIENGKPAEVASGPGLYLTGPNARPRVYNSLFGSNQSYGAGGGAIYADNGSVLQVARSRFIKNQAVNASANGGALYLLDATASVRHSQFSQNSADSWGGAIYKEGSDHSLTIDDSSFVANETLTDATPYGHGGALYSRAGVTNLTRCGFVDNLSRYYGGAIYLYGNTAIANVRECRFSHNAAGVPNAAGTCGLGSGQNGGAVTVYQGTLNLYNSILNGNRAEYGAGIYIISHGKANLYHVTAVDNCQRKDKDGSGLYNQSDGSGVVYNSIFWNNAPIAYGGIYDLYPGNGEIDVNYSQLNKAWSGLSTLGENFQDDCLLDANYGLPAGSVCIDSAYGLPGLPEHDCDGHPRVDDLDVKNTGGGSPDYYDRGACERIP